MGGEFDYSDSDEARTSKYNSAFTQIYRLDTLWKDCNNFSRTGKLKNWNWTLDRIWMELAGDLPKEDPKLNEFEVIDKKIKSIVNKTLLKQISISSFQPELYKSLMEKELFLRRLQNSLGKGTAFEDNDDDYMDG